MSRAQDKNGAARAQAHAPARPDTSAQPHAHAQPHAPARPDAHGHAHRRDHHEHRHDHHEHRAHGSRRRLALVLALTAVYMLAEALGGWWANSLALLADAGHMLTDAAALALALFAAWFSARPATAAKTFGYYRLEILAALVNGVVLVVIALFICYEAYGRWLDPKPVAGGVLVVVAAGGLAVNLACAWLLHGAHADDLNVRGAWLHVLGDALGSVGALVAGALVALKGWYAADPLISALISGLIIWSSWHLIREATNVLLEGTPAHINLASVEAVILQTDGVEGVHDLHVWTITSGRDALSAHVVHAPAVAPPALLGALRVKLHERFGVDHLTIQMETADLSTAELPPCPAGGDCYRNE
ncbi:MAG TPA: cation diffusion facilitator family transporter [Pyrinomonadaceae bacterium]|jgi:cobalt-zinc-cadmium efflux system protein